MTHEKKDPGNPRPNKAKSRREKQVENLENPCNKTTGKIQQKSNHFSMSRSSSSGELVRYYNVQLW